MSKRYERLASAMVGTPLQSVAERVREARNALTIRREPGLANVLAETRLTGELLARKLRPDTNCIDVGCHLGVMLHQMVTLAPRGRHHAFEPVPYKAEWLRRKFPAVAVHQMALADHDESGTFYVNIGSSALSALRTAKEDHGPTEAIAVETRRLDDVLPDDLEVGFVKIDAIGAELLVLRGAERTLRKHRPIVLFEASLETLDNFGLTAAMIHQYMVEELDYELFSLRGWRVGDPPLSVERLEKAMVFPFEAFNFVALPGS